MTLKRIKRDSPVEIISREELNDYLEILEDVNDLLGSMEWNPKATRVNKLHERIKDHLEKYGIKNNIITPEEDDIYQSMNDLRP